MAFTVSYGGTLSARPIHWSVPSYHFDYVNNQGELSIWMRLAEIDVGDGLTLPIQVNFTPSRGYSTPTLDAPGWMIGLVDAPAFQLDERRFLIYTPAGRYKVFRRQADDPNKLRGYPNWEGEVRGSTIDVRSTTDRLIYRHGRLVEMHLGYRRFELSRSGGVLREIREGGRVVLAVRPNARGDQLELDMGGGQSIWLKFGQRPMVQAVRGERMVAEMARSLDEIRLPDGEVIAFDYAVDADLHPTVSVDEGPALAWQPDNGRMRGDGEWTYEVEPDEWRFYHAAIRRTNAEGQEEFWHRDRRRGIETTIWADGRKEVREWFTRGPATGKTRQRIYFQDKIIRLQEKRAYDEHGNLMLCMYSEFNENAENIVSTVTKYKWDGQLLRHVEYFDQGDIIRIDKYSTEVAQLLKRPIYPEYLIIPQKPLMRILSAEVDERFVSRSTENVLIRTYLYRDGKIIGYTYNTERSNMELPTGSKEHESIDKRYYTLNGILRKVRPANTNAN